MGENGGVLPVLHVPHHTTPIYTHFCLLLAFCARKRVYLQGYYNFSSDAKRVFYVHKRVYLWGASLEGVRKNPPLLAPFLHVYPGHTTLCG